MFATHEYSDAEVKLASKFGFNLEVMKHNAALPIYRVMVETAFMYDMKGPEVDALRRCMRAFNETDESKKIYRLTPEWDAMIGEI